MISAMALSARGQNSPPMPHKYAIEKYLDATGLPAHSSKLKIKTNADCRLKLNNRDVGILKKGEIYELLLPIGRIRIDAACIAYRTDPFTGSFLVTDTALQTFYDVTFASNDPKIKGAQPAKATREETVMSVADPIYKIVEKMPEYPGGQDGLMNFVRSSIKYPDMERKNNIEGKVIVQCVVNMDGTVSEAQVSTRLSPGLDKEAIRITQMLHFLPGRQNGKAVKVYYNIPFDFRLH